MHQKKLKPHFVRNLPALCHQIPYWEISDNAIVFQDGSLGCGWHIVGKDIECCEAKEINDFTSRIRNLLNNLPDGLNVQIIYQAGSDYSDVIDIYEGERFQNDVSQFMTSLRAETFRQEQKEEILFRPRIYFFVRYTPQNSQIKKIKFFETAKKFNQRTREEHERVMDELSRIADNTESSLSACGLGFQRLHAEDLISIVYEFLNPTRSKAHPAPIINMLYKQQEFNGEDIEANPSLSYPSAREQLVFSDLVHNEEAIYLDGYYHAVITLKTAPEFTQAAMARNLLVGLPFHFYYSLNIQVPDQSMELAKLHQRRKMTHALTVNQGLKASDLESESKLSDTEALLRELINTGQKIFYVSATIILKSKEKAELEKMSHVTLSKIRELNSAEGLLEKEAALPVFVAELPLTASKLVRARRMKTANLADFVPFYEPNRGSKYPMCLFKNRENGLFKYDSHADDIPNYSSLVTGVSGSGKSFLTNYILLSFLK